MTKPHEEQLQLKHEPERAQYEEQLTFIRPLISWLKMVEWEGETVPRFTKL